MKLFENFEIIEPDKLCDYYKPGVWAMFGTPKNINEEKFICLNVGKNICIGEELQVDYQMLKKFVFFKAKRYVNQFNSTKFLYPQFANRQDYLYKEISEKYKSITTIMVSDVSENTYTIEKYFAYTTEAEYWVSNGKYSPRTVVDSNKIMNIKNAIDVSKVDVELIKKIDEFGEKYHQQKPEV